MDKSTTTIIGISKILLILGLAAAWVFKFIDLSTALSAAVAFGSLLSGAGLIAAKDADREK